jgi:hypothetical protein
MSLRFEQMTADQINHMVPGQSAIAALLQSDSQETVTSGAVSLTTDNTYLSVTGTQAYTLANGAFPGQRKRIECSVAASTPAGTLTIATPETTAGQICSATFFFDTVGQAIELLWTGAKWRATRVERAGSSGANGVVVGTTVLTGKNMWAHYSLSVTGTVSSTTTKGIPDGSAVGEMIQVGCATAASTPSGTIALTALTTLGAAGTTLGTFNGTTCYATLRWNGSAWQLVGNTTVVLS